MIIGFLIGSARGLAVAATVLFAVNAVAAQDVVRPQATLVSVPKVKLPKGQKFTYVGTDFTVSLSVSEKGSVTAVNGVNGPGWMCDTAPGVAEMRELAKAAATKAKFKPAFLDGRPVASEMSITLELDLPKIKDTYSGPKMTMSVDRDAPRGTSSASVKTIQGEVGEAQTPVAGVMTMDPNAKPTGDFSSTPQTTDSSKTIGGGVLNGKAVTLTKPPYPRSAQAVRATGTVPVQSVYWNYSYERYRSETLGSLVFDL